MRTLKQRPGRRGPLRVAIAAASIAALAAVAAIAAALAFGSRGPEPITSDRAQIARQLAAHLHAESLRPRRIACVGSGRRFEGVAVIRCNVDYGEPHIVAICGVLRGGRLLTDHADPAIPCGPDGAGWHSPIETFR